MPINQSALQILKELDAVIEQLSDSDFKKALNVLSKASIGQHVRHTLEFFICLMDAKNEGIINYDNRKHDRHIESDRSLARSIIKSINDFLKKENHDFALKLEANYDVTGSEIVLINSNFSRELAYNIEHAIHHMALIKIGAADAFPHVILPEHFGVASSTIRFQNSH